MLSGMFRAVAVLGVVICGSPAWAGITFVVSNKGGASAAMVAGVTQAAALWAARLDDPITVNVRIDAASLPNGVTGHTDSFYDPYPYADVRAALFGDRRSADDISSGNKLQGTAGFSMLINRTANNPAGVVSATPYFDTGLGGAGQAGAENNTTVRITTANAKALGLYPAASAGIDATITFATGIAFDYDRSDGIAAGKVDFVGVAAHEMGHMLGFVSGVDVLAGNATAPGLNDNQLKDVTPLDLFRFSSRSIGAGGGVGVIDWTVDTTAKYFSVDGGATAVAGFSDGVGFEASHWMDDAGLGIMDPTVGGGELLAISENDLRALDVVGYDRVPEPGVCMLAVAGMMGLAVRRRHG